VIDIIFEALTFIPQESLDDSIRLIAVTLESGADPFTALAAVFRWTEGRALYRGVHEGLQEFFLSVTR